LSGMFQILLLFLFLPSLGAGQVWGGGIGAQGAVVSVVAHGEDGYIIRSRSGAVVNDGGAVLTTRNAVKGAQRLEIRYGGRRIGVERNIAVAGAPDLVLLKISAPGLAGFKSGDASEVRGGDPVQVVTASGYVLNGRVSDVVAVDGRAAVFHLDMAAAPAEEGSPVLDRHGMVVAVVTGANVPGKGGTAALPLRGLEAALQDLEKKEVKKAQKKDGHLARKGGEPGDLQKERGRFPLYEREHALPLSPMETMMERFERSVAVVEYLDGKGAPADTRNGFFIHGGEILVAAVGPLKTASRVIVKTGGSRGNIRSILFMDRKHDLAVLRTSPFDVESLLISPSGRVYEGQKVYVLGSPGGRDRSIVEGRVRKVVKLGNETVVFGVGAPVPDETAGAPVLDEEGRVIGVIHAGNGEDGALAFAVPVERLVREARAGDGLPFDRFHRGEKEAGIREWLDMARRYRDLGMYSEAVSAYRRVLKMAPASAEALRGIGEIYRMEGKYRMALEVLKRNIQSMPEDVEGHYLMGRVYRDMGMYEAALKSFRKAVDIDPGFAPALESLGILCFSLGRYLDSAEYFERLSVLEPDSAIVFYNLGVAYSKTGMHADAIRAFRKARELKRNFAAAIMRLAIEYSRLNNRRLAQQQYEDLLRIAPGRAESLQRLINE